MTVIRNTALVSKASGVLSNVRRLVKSLPALVPRVRTQPSLSVGAVIVAVTTTVTRTGAELFPVPRDAVGGQGAAVPRVYLTPRDLLFLLLYGLLFVGDLATLVVNGNARSGKVGGAM